MSKRILCDIIMLFGKRGEWSVKLFRSALFAPALIMAAALLGSVFILHYKTADYSRWQPAQAVIEQRIQLRSLKDRVYYSFELDGAVLEGSDLLHRHEKTPPAGSVVRVWFDPADPKRTSLWNRPSAEFDSWAPVFIALPLSFGVLMLGLKRERGSVS